MAVKLNLKRRKDETRQVPVAVVVRIVNGPGSDGDKLAQLRELEQHAALIHDKAWLAMIINWAGEKGLPLTETAKWSKVAARVGELDDEREGKFTLSDFQVRLIWERMNNPDFKIIRNSPALAGFILDFCEAAGKAFGGDVDTEEIDDAA